MIALVLFVAIVPLAISRALSIHLMIPNRFVHDPLFLQVAFFLLTQQVAILAKLDLTGAHSLFTLWKTSTALQLTGMYLLCIGLIWWFNWFLWFLSVLVCLTIVGRMVVKRLASYLLLGLLGELASSTAMTFPYFLTTLSPATVDTAFVATATTAPITPSLSLLVYTAINSLCKGCVLVECWSWAVSSWAGVYLFTLLGHDSLWQWATQTSATREVLLQLLAKDSPSLYALEIADQCRALDKCLVQPVVDFAWKFFMTVAAVSIGTLLLRRDPSSSSIIDHLVLVVQWNLLFAVVFVVGWVLLTVLRKSILAMEKRVRDDVYLIGRKLVNVRK
jgi:hypothetical protein